MGVELPAALVALVAAAIPLALALRARSRARLAPFPSVELVREVTRASRREWFVAGTGLVCARACAIVFAALALSRPYWGGLPPANRPLAEADVIILLDRSAAWGDVQEFLEARAAAADVIRLARPHGRAVVIPFDDLPGPALPRGFGESVLDSILPSGRLRSMDAALSAAARIASPGSIGRDRRSATLVLLTTPDGLEEALAAGTRPGVRLVAFSPRLERTAARSRENKLKIVDARLAGPAPRVGEKIRVRVRLTRPDAETEAGPRELALRFVRYPDREPRLAARTEIQGGEAGEFDVILEAPRTRPGWELACVEIREPDADPRDLTATGGRYFLLVPALERLRVLVLSYEGQGSAKDMRTLGRAVKALAPASRGSSAVLPFEAASLPASRIDPDVLEAFDAVVVGDAAAIPPAKCAVLRDFVSDGGSLLAFAPGELPPRTRNVLGIGAADARARPPEGAGLRVGNLGGGPAGTRAPEWLREARFASYARLDGPGRTVLTFETGDPALVESRFWMGRASLFAAGLGDLADRPSVLLPLVEALLRLAATRPPSPVVFDASDTPGAVLLTGDGAATAIAATAGRAWSFPVRRAGSHGVPGAGGPAVIPCEHPGLWCVVARYAGTGDEYVERLIGVNAEVAPAGRTPAPSRPGAGDVRLARSREELLELLRGRGSSSLAVPAVALAFLAMAAELALIGRQRRTDREHTDPLRGREGGAS